MLLVPFCVLLAWAMRQPLDLNFNEFEALVLFVAVLLAVVVLQVRVCMCARGAALRACWARGCWALRAPPGVDHWRSAT